MPEPYVGKLASTVLRGRKLPSCATAHDEKQMLCQKKEFQEVHRFELKQLGYRKISEQHV